MTDTDTTADAIREAAAKVAAAGESSPRSARDPVNQPLVNNWIEAIGDENPVYTDPVAAAASVHGGLVAPPAMIQAWTMPGLHGGRADDDPLGKMTEVLDTAGFTSVVATNCDQTYYRYLRHGERLTVRASLVDVTGPKPTGLGEGWFVTTRSTWYSGDEPVAAMDFRILKFRPPVKDGQAGSTPAKPAGPGAGSVMRPQVTPDTAFFWDGTRSGELRIQQCANCEELRYPPGPMCPKCGNAARGTNTRSDDKAAYAVARGTGEIYSFVVHRHPPVPGKRLPMVIAVVELPEGVRMTGEVLGVAPEEVRIGMPVRIAWDRIDDDLTLPAWRPAAQEVLPPLSVHASATFIVSSALATRDFQDVHHDRDLAVAKGSKDIFVNILTTTGLVQRFVAGWAGHDAVFKSIAIRLGAPCYAGDTLDFSGVAVPDGDEWAVTVTGTCGLGSHVTGTVRVALPGRQQ
jgi:uncharacterized OB-fold protein/acyl dehydratase